MKKIFLLLATSLLMVNSLQALQTWDGTSSEAWTNGSGTEADPYLIETPAHLKYLSAQVGAGNTYVGVHFRQTDNFDLKSKTWTPIGTSTYKFAGVYDGGERYISNLKTSQYGLFGITENAKVKNISFQGTYSSSSASVSAPLIGTAQGVTEIVNCHNQATITGACAGLIANATGTSISLHKCSNQASIIISSSGAYSYAGGLIARVGTTDLVMDECFNVGEISTTTSGYEQPNPNYADSWSYAYSGGLLGSVTSTGNKIISRCFNSANVKANITAKYIYSPQDYLLWRSPYAAGFVGNGSDIRIISCYSKGTAESVSTGTNRGCSSGFVCGTTEIIGCYLIGGNSIGSGIIESCYKIDPNSSGGTTTQTATGSNFYSNTSDGIYKSDVAFKAPSMIPLLNTMDEFFTMDLEGINDGYPILTWQKGTRYNINATCDPARGTVKGGGEYALGNTVTLTATPKYGSTFVGWSDGNIDNPRTITVEGDATYIAQFTKSAYTIYVNQDGTSYIE
jgi:hypothetical protein